eukprot:5586127-Amphidinium_carterae.1
MAHCRQVRNGFLCVEQQNACGDVQRRSRSSPPAMGVGKGAIAVLAQFGTQVRSPPQQVPDL